MKKNIIKNIIQLYGLSIAKLIFPLITLPYLTRVLSVDAYGTVAYVKTIMSYMQIIIDFGFMLSGTKEIIECKEEKRKLSYITSKVLFARILLCIISFCVLVISSFLLPILRNNILYTYLSFIPILLSVFLFDYVFRGLEKMNVITNRFVIMRGISTIMTIVVIKDESQLLLIPVLDIIGTLTAVALVLVELKKLDINLVKVKKSEIISTLKVSSIYFASDMATTIFGALNTVIIGIFLTTKEVAYWSVCIQLITAVQSMYSPITNGVYPEMVRSKNIDNIKKLLRFFIPLILIGCILAVLLSEKLLIMISGEQYAQAAYVFIMLIPLLLISFPAMILGWPTLGAIEKQKEVTITTVISAIVQVIGLFVLYESGILNLITLSILRIITEMVLLGSRFFMCMKFRKLFCRGN